MDWYHERYMNPAAVRDLHPVGSEYWNAEVTDPFTYLPPFMTEHPRLFKAVAA